MFAEIAAEAVTIALLVRCSWLLVLEVPVSAPSLSDAFIRNTLCTVGLLMASRSFVAIDDAVSLS